MWAKERTRSWHLQKELWSQSTLRPQRIIKVPTVLLSHSVSLCPLLLLLLLLSLFLFCLAWSARARWGCLITLIHTYTPTAASASFSFHSRQQRLPRRALARRKVMLKYFRRKCTPYCSFSGCRAEFQSQFSFVFENKEGETLMRRLQKLFFLEGFFFFLVAKLNLLCGKLMSSLCSGKQIRYLARTASLYFK